MSSDDLIRQVLAELQEVKTAVAKLTEAAERGKEERCNALLRLNAGEESLTSSSNEDCSLSMMNHFGDSPSGEKRPVLTGIIPPSVVLHKKVVASRETSIASLPADVLRFMDNEADCLDLLKVHFSELHYLR